MKTTSTLGKTLLIGFASTVLLFGTVSMASSDSPRRPEGPLCGPSLQWSCSKSPMGPAQLFNGTQCEAARFEKKTGTTCVPLGSK